MPSIATFNVVTSLLVIINVLKLRMNTLSIFSLLLLFQDDITSNNDGVPYTPTEGFGGWLLWAAGIAVLAILAFVVIKVFRNIQRSRHLERMAEDANASNKGDTKL